MQQERQELGVLFVDISDSSHLFNAYGNEGARGILQECILVLRRVVEASPGRVVERIGDELLAVFPTPTDTVRTAVDLQMAIAEARASGRIPGFLSVRIGFHYGEVLNRDDELFGDTLYTANRICSLAKGNEILTTGDTVAALPTAMRGGMRRLETRALKGKRQVHDVVRVPWDDPMRTVTGTGGAPAGGPDQPERELDLATDTERVTLSSNRPVFTIGRDAQCDLQVERDDVSRVHARIEYRNARFVLVDLSSNGTVVQSDGGEETQLRRGELGLNGTGAIRVGRDAPTEIRFACRPADSIPSHTRQTD